MKEQQTPKYRLAAVWFADIVGYSELAARNEPEALGRVRAFQEAVRDVVAASEGRLVKFLGDGALAEFPNTLAAVEAALALPNRFRDFARAVDATLRIGIHVGDVAPTSDGDLYGDGVNVAARLQHEADPGQVVVSEDVWNQIRRHPRFASVDLGKRALKGVGSVRLRALHWSDATTDPLLPASVGRPGHHRRRNLAFLGIGAIVALAGTGVATWVQSRGENPIEEAPADSTLAQRDTVIVVDTVPALAAPEPPGTPTSGPPVGAADPPEVDRRTDGQPGIVVPPRVRRRITDAIRNREASQQPRDGGARQPRADQPPPEDEQP
jgi:adenylate cyclase